MLREPQVNNRITRKIPAKSGDLSYLDIVKTKIFVYTNTWAQTIITDNIQTDEMNKKLLTGH